MTNLIDSIVLSNFAAVGRLDLLRLRWSTLYMARSVYEELQAGSEEGYHFLTNLEDFIFPVHPDGWIHLTALEGENELAFYQAIVTKLHRGEAMSLAIAKQRGWRFLTDDRAARRYASQVGAGVIGTAGVLAQLVRLAFLDLGTANLLLKQMVQQARYYAPVTDLSLLIPEQQTGKPKDQEE